MYGQGSYPQKTSPIGIVELKFLKYGCPQSENTTTGKRYNSGPLREQLLVRTMEQSEDPNVPITADLSDINDGT